MRGFGMGRIIFVAAERPGARDIRQSMIEMPENQQPAYISFPQRMA